MHPNPIYNDADRRRNLDFARERGFGVLAVSGAEAPMLAHLPFLLDAEGAVAEMHLLRSNPIARALDAPLAARLAVSGPDTYVSPDWYGVADQVPTWNYVAVHLTGTLETCSTEGLRDLLDRQSAGYEARLLPKTPWTTAKMTPDVRDRLLRSILPVRMTITEIDGTWKLGQNKSEPARDAAATQIAAYGFGSDAHVIAALMRGVGKGN